MPPMRAIAAATLPSPYNYPLPAAAPANLFGAELTGCSMTADNCHDADEREFKKASNFFACWEYLARARQL
jgi:hypothetical protein